MKPIIFNKGYDLKTEDNEISPAPQWMKYCLLIVAALLAFSIGYSGFRVIRHLVQKGGYDRMVVENIRFKNEIKAMEEQAVQSQALAHFFDAQQSWLKGKMAVTGILIKVFEALPNEVFIEEAHLNEIRTNNVGWDLRIECCEQVGADAIQAFKLSLDEAKILFQPRNDRASSKIQGRITNFEKNL